jgi:hypothetical protein
LHAFLFEKKHMKAAAVVHNMKAFVDIGAYIYVTLAHMAKALLHVGLIYLSKRMQAARALRGLYLHLAEPAAITL